MALHQEGKFFQGTTPGVGPLFVPLEGTLREIFILDLLGGRQEEVTEYLRKRITWG